MKPEPPAPGLRIEYRRLAELRRWPRNPRAHDVDAIAGSAREFGFRDPLAINRTTQEIEEGHGRLDSLQAMKGRGEAPPAFVRVDPDGEWLVPTLPFEDTREMQERYAIAHNRVHERGETQAGPLADVLRDLAATGAMQGTGYDARDLDALLRKIAADGNAVSGAIAFSHELDEENNYVVLFFRSSTDFLQAMTVLQLETVYAKRRNGKPWSKGIGRVVDGPTAIKRIQAER